MPNENEKTLIAKVDGGGAAGHALSKRLTVPNLLSEGGDARYFGRFFSIAESQILFDQLKADVKWSQESIVIFGKRVMQPRLTALYGDEGRSYRYSGITMEPKPWTNALIKIKSRIEEEVGLTFNVALLNFYRDGQDSMGWHRDDEKELGPNPVIGSVSFGATRALHFRSRENKTLKRVVELEDGSLLIMSGETQHRWYHAIMKTKRPLGARINITFRDILPIRA